jgi:hypothetical protein
MRHAVLVVKQALFDRCPSALLEFESGESLRLAAMWWEQPLARGQETHDANWLVAGIDVRLGGTRWRAQGSLLSWELVDFGVLEGILGLRAQQIGDDRCQVIVELHGEFLPEDRRWDEHGLLAAPKWALVSTHDQLEHFAQQLDRLVEAFPRREPAVAAED